MKDDRDKNFIATTRSTHGEPLDDGRHARRERLVQRVRHLTHKVFRAMGMTAIDNQARV